jgi:hypothetical protein
LRQLGFHTTAVPALILIAPELYEAEEFLFSCSTTLFYLIRNIKT